MLIEITPFYLVLFLVIGGVVIASASRSKSLFAAIASLVRLPFLLAGIVLWSLIMPFMLFYALIILPILGFPIDFLHGVFANSVETFRENMGDIADHIKDSAAGAFRPYRSMFFLVYWHKI